MLHLDLTVYISYSSVMCNTLVLAKSRLWFSHLRRTNEYYFAIFFSKTRIAVGEMQKRIMEKLCNNGVLIIESTRVTNFSISTIKRSLFALCLLSRLNEMTRLSTIDIQIENLTLIFIMQFLFTHTLYLFNYRIDTLWDMLNACKII